MGINEPRNEVDEYDECGDDEKENCGRVNMGKEGNW
jgi:hypothetical protein